jgi:serine/threonine protein kinase/tetratricopeptide (TPR) repeat protein
VGVLTPPPTDAPGWPPSVPETGDESSLVTQVGRSFAEDAATRVSGARPASTRDFLDQNSTVPAAARPRGEATGPLQVGQSFGPRYHIIKTLGVGGMGAVYQGWDAELAEVVAIKVIRPEAMANPQAAWEMEKRFKRELLLARQVTHKNVVRIHDLGEIDGIKYITMSFVEGTDLATLLKEEGALSVERAIRITRSMIAGLQAAHAVGVVHRDLKPGNIMVRTSDAEALIMDFGIARSTSTPSASDVSTVTALPADLRHSATRYTEATVAGSIVGTVPYMAPEQARGEEVDQRADIYAVGLILYDMLAGRHRANTSSSALAELQLRMKQPPTPIQSVAPQVPDALNRLVSKCLEPEASNRYPTTDALAADLDRLDDAGGLRPVKRAISLPVAAALATLFASVAGAGWWYTRPTAPPPEHDPVSVMIADFRNSTGDAAFDRTLEPALRIALEGASFIAAYDRTQMRNLGLPAVEGALDEAAARRIALNQGFGVVLTGALSREDEGYQLSITALEAVTGNVIRSNEAVASSRDEVLTVATRLATTVRTALGDEMSESAQMFAMETLNARSLDVIHEYAAGMESLNNGRYADALASARKAADLDPDFGAAFGVMAAAARGLGQRQESETYIKEAVARLDRVTERERYRIRGLSFLLSGDQQKCVEEYTALISRYAADATAHNNLALCATQLRDMPRAIAEMKEAVAILPKSVRQRSNLAVYASYGGDFATAEREAQELQKLDPMFPKGFTALAFAFLGQDRLADAAGAYQRLQGINASDAASGLADLALFQGRLTEAVRILETGAAADIAARAPDRAADKLSLLAFTQLTRGQTRAALQAAERALDNSQGAKTRFLAGRTFALAGNADRARAMAQSLGGELSVEPQAYARIIEGNIALRAGNAREAIQALTEANKLLDTWLGRLDLGRAYLEAGAYLEADAEFDRCVKRRGEAMALFLDEIPTYGYFPQVYYYIGRAREGLKTASFGDSYRAFLNIRGAAGEDPLLADARKRSS